MIFGGQDGHHGGVGKWAVRWGLRWGVRRRFFRPV